MLCSFLPTAEIVSERLLSVMSPEKDGEKQTGTYVCLHSLVAVAAAAVVIVSSSIAEVEVIMMAFNGWQRRS